MASNPPTAGTPASAGSKRPATAPLDATTSGKTADGEYQFDLTSKRRVTVRTFRGQVYVDIREYYSSDTGEMKPGKKGISLTVEQFESFRKLIPEIEDAVAAIKK